MSLLVHLDYKYVFLLVILIGQLGKVWSEEYKIENANFSPLRYNVVTLERQRRDAANPQNTSATVPTKTNITETPIKGTEKGTTETAVSVTQTPLLGVNGSGILHVNVMNNMPKVSDPIVPDDNFTDMFETPERIKSEHNISNLTIDNHNFYNSTFIGNLDYFNEHWANITNHKPIVHSLLSNTHRSASSIHLSFDFPFYGHYIRNVTVATGGFIYTGEHEHNWLATTQYVAPLMANFDTRLTNDSLVKLYDDGEKFTAFWENVTLQEDPSVKFTFAATLYKNGDIIFAYKSIPIDVQAINDTNHPVKVGISDAYLNDKILFYVRRKTIYEYHRVSFKDHLITNNTLLKLIALPTCLQYETCDSCINHDTGFNCTWCPQIQKCSSGTDRNKQDWLLRKCERTTIVNASACAPYNVNVGPGGIAVPVSGNTAYTTDKQGSFPQDTVVKNAKDKATVEQPAPGDAAAVSTPKEPQAHSAIGGVVVSFIVITLIVSALAWVYYAFKNPHTRSGQILIKYRPSQWNWRRGEARYTAATIHM